MGVNRSGYYKWKKRQGTENRYEQKRRILTQLLVEKHEQHRSYGYHRLAAVVRTETGLTFSDNLAHKCCKYVGIKSRIRHYRWKKPGSNHLKFGNIVSGKWETTAPMEIIVSDMTVMRHKGKRFEWTYMLDVFNNEIISSHISYTMGSPRPYFDCLEDILDKAKEQTNPVILHTDQGSVYSSRAFFNAHKDCNIKRSMSRTGTPTDNPVIESMNGWIKAEIYAEGWHKKYESGEEMISEFIRYYNNERPAYALNYKSPVQYRNELGFG